MKKQVVVHVTEEWYRNVLAEADRHPMTECAVQMPGIEEVYQTEIEDEHHFYFDMAADSGIHATYSYMQVEKDHAYTDHVCNRILDLYDVAGKKVTCAIMHKHPSKCGEFSSVDRVSNQYLAETYGGAVAGLMWVDPEFHLKFWYFDKEGRIYPAKTVLDDDGVRKAMPKKNIQELIAQVEKKEHEERFSLKGRNPISNYFRLAKKDDLAADEEILEAFPEIKEEFQEIGKDRKINLTRRPDRTWLFSVSKNSNDSLWFSVKREKGETFFITQGCWIPYERGLLTKLLESDDIEEFIPLETRMERNTAYLVYIPEEMKKNNYTGPLYGYYHQETKTFNVVSDKYRDQMKDVSLIGFLKDETEIDVYDLADEYFLCGVWLSKDGSKELKLQVGGLENEVDIDWISFSGEAFSRNNSLVESVAMGECEVNILGVGSVGSYIALECARLGIGRINLFDDDKLQYHNISRHQCGIRDVGRFKVEAVKEKILNINPYCEVNAFPEMIQHVDPVKLEDVIHKKSVFICGADNRHAAHVCIRLSDQFHIPMVTVGCGTRASTGEIYYYKPDCNMIRYEEAFGKDRGVDYTNQQVRRRFYATESDLEKMTFQPGLYLDITLTSILAAKLSVDLLMEGTENYEPKLLPYMKQGILIVNHPTKEEVNPLMKAFSSQRDGIRPLQWINVVGNRNGGLNGNI